MNETAASELTVFRTRLPYVDRRSLSEAWMSALGLQRDRPGVSAAPRAARTDPTPLASGGLRESSASRARPRTAAAYPAASASRRDAGIPRPTVLPVATLPVRVRPTPGAAPPLVARARSYPARRSSLVVGVDGTRVQLVLRREGSTLHVVALCRSDVASTVGLASAAPNDSTHARRRTPRDGARARRRKRARMIDPSVSSAFERLAARERDVLHAFEPGFEHEKADVAGRAGVQAER